VSSTNFPFGPQTVGALVRALADGKSHSELTTLFMSLGLERWDRQGERINKETRVQGVIEGMRKADGETEARAAVELARTMVAAGGGRTIWWNPLVDALAADGLDWDEEEEKLIPAVPSLSVPEERSWIGRRLTARGWEDSAAHYRQCADGVAARNWESANGQGRSLLEDLIPRAAGELGGPKAPGSPARRCSSCATRNSSSTASTTSPEASGRCATRGDPMRGEATRRRPASGSSP
jgi:hypothetical protein